MPDYGSMYNSDDPAAVEPAVDELAAIEDAVEAAVEVATGEDVDVNITEDVTPEGTFVRVDIDPVAKLRVRDEASNDGEIIGSLRVDTVLRVVDTANPDWTLVETEVDGEVVQGYVKNTYVAPTSAPNE
jgi:hypothetical protein